MADERERFVLPHRIDVNAAGADGHRVDRRAS